MIATHAQIAVPLVDDAQTLDELGLDPLDLILIVVQLGTMEELQGDFPFAELDRALTVGDLVRLVDAWRARASVPSLVEGRTA
jgi:acyl carrier protein